MSFSGGGEEMCFSFIQRDLLGQPLTHVGINDFNTTSFYIQAES